MFDINGTFLIVFVSFIAFVVMMKNLFFDPLMTTVEKRQALLDGAEATAVNANARKAEVDATVQQKLQAAYRQAQQSTQQQANVAREKATALKLAVKAEATQQVATAVNALGQQAEQSYQQLQSEKPEMASLIVAKVAGKVPANV